MLQILIIITNEVEKKSLERMDDFSFGTCFSPFDGLISNLISRNYVNNDVMLI